MQGCLHTVILPGTQYHRRQGEANSIAALTGKPLCILHANQFALDALQISVMS